MKTKRTRFLSVLLCLALTLSLTPALCGTALAAGDEYTITWLNDDGSVITTTTVAPGTVPTAPADPEKSPTPQYTYDFKGWTPAVVAATEDATYTATYEQWEKLVEIYDDRCYIDGERARGAGLVLFDGNYYYVKQNGSISGSASIFINATKANGFFPAGTYEFDPDLHTMIIKDGIVRDEHGDYYYENNVKAKDKGVVQIGGDYYYVKKSGAIAKNGSINIDSAKANDLVPAGRYAFDETGKMILKNGIVGDYYYEFNVIVKGKGVVELEGDLYYVKQNGSISKNSSVFIGSAKANDLVPAGRYDFDADGKMILDS